MAQWYAQLLFKGEVLLGESLADLALVEGPAAPNGGDGYTAVVVSGYALHGRLRGYYALGVAHLVVDPVSGRAAYASEASARHQEAAGTLTAAQRSALRGWLIELNPSAWDNSTEVFRKTFE